MSCKLFEKRGQWCFRDENQKLHKFSTKEEAKKALEPLSSEKTAYELQEAEVEAYEGDE
jgi:ribosomal protein L20A (L18A)